MNDYTSRIPIKNIYYMLCYAFEMLDMSNKIQVGTDEFDNIYNLFAKIYLYETNNIVRRGLHKYYKLESESSAIIKGKIDITNSINELSIIKGKIRCKYDSFENDILINRIVKSTINLLVISPNLDENLKIKLYKLRLYFHDVKDIKLSKQLFNKIKYNKNNYHYRVLINISELMIAGLIANNEDVENKFLNFLNEDRMAMLYEKFVLNFYKHNLDKNIYKVHSPKIKWNLVQEIFRNGDLLPEMRTDTVIENNKSNQQLIIDTKYYRNTLVSSNYSEKERIRVSHLYQIYAYIQNSNFIGTKSGMLLYPKVTQDINEDYYLTDCKMSVKTINLNSEWRIIEKKMLSFIDNYY